MNLSNLFGTGVVNATGKGAHAAADPGFMSMLPMLAGFALIFYFLMIRPQNKRSREHRNLLSGLSKNDEVTTSGGVLGRVVTVQDNFVTLQIAKDINMTVQKSAVTAVMPKGTLPKESKGTVK